MLENILTIALTVGTIILYVGLYKLIKVFVEWLKNDMRGNK